MTESNSVSYCSVLTEAVLVSEFSGRLDLTETLRCSDPAALQRATSETSDTITYRSVFYV